ncbi:PREDICTED: probable insulin-like peptide 7 [Priapulus caudatus]|uniref:Probable insulin-like peptide 7 n=1 Tax=Priapulus caudatus TaxID=37621 RepID=A0ABM1EC58_PRICU|nr:PREDICTED: probable insulin-like peptide 7 [Priapulus caudatus]
MFQARTESEWRSVWHVETYRRCWHQLRPHISIACKKDIYRITKRTSPVEQNSTSSLASRIPLMIHKDGVFDINEVLTAKRAHSFLRSRGTPTRRVARNRNRDNIVTECCVQDRGCTWEEYAEYCPTHKRTRG